MDLFEKEKTKLKDNEPLAVRMSWFLPVVMRMPCRWSPKMRGWINWPD